MNEEQLDQLLDAWLEHGPAVAPERVAIAARLEARSTRQATAVLGWARRIAGWPTDDRLEGAEHELITVPGQPAPASERAADRLRWRSRMLNTIARLAAVAVAATLVAIAVITLAPSGGNKGGPPTSGGASASASPSPTNPAPAGFVGLPPTGSTPSDPAAGELVLRFDSSIGSAGRTMWVYADGRLLWHQLHMVRPTGMGDAFIGLVEQRLTPGGVDYLRSTLVSTGLFADDLTLAREGNAPFLEIRMKNGDQWVDVTWAWRGIAGNAPVATQEQEDALTALNDLLADPSSWPASIWEDEAASAYVPSEYSICFGVRLRDAAPGVWRNPYWLGPVEPATIWALLPDAAQDVLRAAEAREEPSMHQDAGCSRMTTDDAREVAQILRDAGIEPDRPETGAFWLAYTLEDDAAGTIVWMQFGPVLPDGTARFLGPG
jgi:hypothetical protein